MLQIASAFFFVVVVVVVVVVRFFFFFALDHTHYARWLQFIFTIWNVLKQIFHAVIAAEFKNGNFVMNKTSLAFFLASHCSSVRAE